MLITVRPIPGKACEVTNVRYPLSSHGVGMYHPPDIDNMYKKIFPSREGHLGIFGNLIT